MTGTSVPDDLDQKAPMDAGSGSSGPWRYAYATQVGLMHTTKGDGREDAVGIYRHDQGIVAVVADGHGMRRAFRAHVGSELAVRAAIDCAVRGNNQWAAATADAQAWLAGEFTREVVAAWRSLVVGHVAEHPIIDPEPTGDGETEETSATAPADLWLTYGTTALMAIATGSRLLLWQLGDGDIVVESADGTGESPLPEDSGNFANRTSSLCLPDAVERARCTLKDLATDECMALLATDGFGNAMAAPDWRARLTVDLRRQIDESGFEDVAESLPGWCATCTEASGDDVTVVVLSFDSSAVPRSSPNTTRTTQHDDGISDTVRIPGGRLRPRSRLWTIVGGLSLIALAILVLFWTELVRLPVGTSQNHPPATVTPAPPVDSAPTEPASPSASPASPPPELTPSTLPTLTASTVPAPQSPDVTARR